MSRWQTVSVIRLDGTTDTFQRYNSGGKNPKVETVLSTEEDCYFEGDTFYLSEFVSEAYLVTFSNTSDSGNISCITSGQSWNVYRHNGSLWTADVNPGPSYEWKEDILSKIPDWVEVGGNWNA